MTIDAIGLDIDIYAFCEGDVFFSAPASVSNARWTIEEKYTGKYVATEYGNPIICNLKDPGTYEGKLTAQDSNGNTYTYTQKKVVDGEVKKTFRWKYGGTDYGATWTTDYSTYAYYKELSGPRRHTTLDKDSEFVQYTSKTIETFADYLLNESKYMSRADRANFILAFVGQAITYETDAKGSGYNEYWKYPCETLFDMAGDCEDSAILYAAIMKAAGYDACLLLFDDHMATGIGMPDGTTGTYWTKGGIRYYYCETTASGWLLGKIPSSYKSSTAYVIVI
jgi:predicted transglutaminase-like cysteine proteinase